MNKMTFTELGNFILRCHLREFQQQYRNVYYSIMGKGKPYPSFIDIDNALYYKAGLMYFYAVQEELDIQKTAFLNNIGSVYEKEGLIDKAIEAYEECAKIGYKATHCYERLRILYKKRKDTENMNRIIARMEEVMARPKTWQEMETKRYFNK